MTSHTKNIRGDFTKALLALETIRAEVSEEALVERPIETSEYSSQDLAETFVEAFEYPHRDLFEDRRGVSEGDLVESPIETSEVEQARGETQAHPSAVRAQAPPKDHYRVHEPKEPRALNAGVLVQSAHIEDPSDQIHGSLVPAASELEAQPSPRYLHSAAYEDSTGFVAPSKCLELSPWTSQVHDPCALNARKTKPKEEQDISARSNEPCGEGGFKWEHEPRALMAQFEWRSRTFLDLDLSPSSPI